MASEAGKPETRRWVALASIPVVNGANDKGAEATAPDTADLLRLELHHPPRASYLALPERLAPDTSRRERNNFFPRVMAAGSDRFLLFATKGRADADDYFLCDIMAGTATRLPAVPLEMGLKLLPRRSIGVVADPRRPGHAMIAQLHANVITKARHDALLRYSTATGQWAVKPLKSAPDHERWGAHGVFAHGGLLWWVDIAHGILVCDPFDDDETPHLRFVPLPEACGLQHLDQVVTTRTRTFLDERRCIRPSEGKMRCVEIRGFSNDDTAATANEPPSSPAVWVWTLVDPNGTSPWKREYEALFTDIWDDDSYIAAGLPHGKVPKLAFVDPNNHRVVYFFQDASLFGLDVRARRVVACEECFIDRVVQDLRFQCSGFIDAWVLPLPPRGDHASSDGGSGMKGLDVTTGRDDELAYLLNQMEIKGQNSQTLDRNDGAPDGTVMQPRAGRWVILSSKACTSTEGHESISFHWEAPPRVSVLIIDAGLLPEAQATVRIRAADPSGWLLLQATHDREMALILCNACKRSAERLPEAGRSLDGRSLGLIPDARDGGHCVVAHLEPLCGTNRATLFCYDTKTRVWEEKDANCVVLLPEAWNNSGVISHAGLLWWFDLSNGQTISCNPFLHYPYLRRVSLPRCAASPTEIASHLGLSDGKLRLITVAGPMDSPTITVSTLKSTDGQTNTWSDDFTVPFLDIRADANCSWAELLRKSCPGEIAVIHPRNCGILCFLDNFNGTDCIYGVDMKRKCTVESQAVEVERALDSSLSVLAWELPLQVTGDPARSSSSTEDKPWSQISRGLRGVLNFKQSCSRGLAAL